MKLRVNKLISDAGLGSRREAEAYIRHGRILLNGKRAQLGDLVDEEDTLLFDGVDLPVKELIRDHISTEKLDASRKKNADRPRTQSRRDERAESQRLLSAPKSAALRRTSKNNPVNKQRYLEQKFGLEPEEAAEQAPAPRRSGQRGRSRLSTKKY